MTELSSPLLGAEVRLLQEPPVEADPTRVRLLDDNLGSLLTVGGLGSFQVSADGDVVLVRLQEDADQVWAQSYLHGTVSALVLARQGRYALHATAVRRAGPAVAVAGPSGAGKSTTSLRLVQRGCTLVADDVSPLDLEEGGVRVTPFGRPVHLWPATAALLGMDVSGAAPFWPGSDKLSLPVPPALTEDLSAVVVLKPVLTGEVTRRRLRGAEAAAAVAANAYRVELLPSRYLAGLLPWAARVAVAAPVWSCTRPADRWCVDEVAEAVEALLI